MERDKKEPIPQDSGQNDIDETDESMDGGGRTTNPDSRPAEEVNPASDDTGITDLDKTLADSFPASDPPAPP
jgi:hypothetical protein